MAALSHTSKDATTRALAGGIIYQPCILQELDAAHKASNPRSALLRLKTAQYDLANYKQRVDDAVAELERDVRSDEDAAEEAFVRALDFSATPKLRLVR